MQLIAPILGAEPNRRLKALMSTLTTPLRREVRLNAMPLRQTAIRAEALPRNFTAIPVNDMAIPHNRYQIPANDNSIPRHCNPIPRNDNSIPHKRTICDEAALICSLLARK